MSNESQQSESALNNAPAEIKLAVDLIQILEDNQIPVNTAIEALEIVLSDFKLKAVNSHN